MKDSRLAHVNTLFALTTLALAFAATHAHAAPKVTRLTPPSELFQSGAAAPMIARFLPGQRFDLQATVSPDEGKTIESFQFLVDDKPVIAKAGTTSLVTTGLVKGQPANTAVVSLRAYSNAAPGVHKLTVTAKQSDGAIAKAVGNFEVVRLAKEGRPVKNVILLLGDGMGAAHRTAARIVTGGYTQGKATKLLAMDTFPVTGQVMTASLNSIVTDSSPGMSNYVTGNKGANNQEGVFPDDTEDAFDNPRVEYLAEYLHRTQGKALGIVTTADVFDATPAANAVHTSNRGAGTGIADQYLDDRGLTGLTVLLGGGRKWFLPNPSNDVKPQAPNGSQRRKSNDYVLPDDLVAGWGAARGVLDPERDLLADFQKAGFSYAPDRAGLDAAAGGDKLLGLFAFSNMNVAYDKIAGRRGDATVVDAYGFPDQPMLDEMARAALQVLSKNKRGFVAMIEGASIDKQSHLMDTDRWILDVVEFDRAVQVAKDFAAKNPDTLVIVTADHECSGAAIIGASTQTYASLRANAGEGVSGLRDGANQTPPKAVVGTYEAARFPRYAIQPDGYPMSTNVDYRMLIGYGANADRYETWLSTSQPTQDPQQPFIGVAPLSLAPATPKERNKDSGFLVTGQVSGESAVHTATDIPLSAMGRGAHLFTGVYDNTDVFFKIGQLVVGGTR
ncbi:alkaline phosphatase [Betaproteobacteria bacterium GR16-43]|nr:alkaline phosphatase [Betaproteobacteria bacterium GR16-43]